MEADVLERRDVLSPHIASATMGRVRACFLDVLTRPDEDGFGAPNGTKARPQLGQQVGCFGKGKHSLRSILVVWSTHSSGL